MQVENTDGKQRQFAMRNTRRSGCSLNLTLEMLGDRWSLMVIRDVMFGNRRHFGDLIRLSADLQPHRELVPLLAELRGIHLGAPAPRRSVFAELQAALESAVKRQSAKPSATKT
jgi:hypothetical protein